MSYFFLYQSSIVTINLLIAILHFSYCLGINV